MLEIFRKSDAKPFSKNHVHADLLNRISRAIAAKIVDRCDALRWLVENRAIPRSVKIAHTPVANVASSLPMSAHLLRDQIRHRLDWKTVAMFGIDLSRTVKMKSQIKWKIQSLDSIERK